MSESDSAGQPDTTQVRLAPGTEQPYRRLHPEPGEPHMQRSELLEGAALGTSTSVAPSAASPPWVTAGRRLAGIIHFTDFQIADLASPSRAEYLQRLTGVPTWERMLPAYRPEEFLLPHAIESMVRAIRAFSAGQPAGEAGARPAMASPVSTWDLALTTGDNADSAQGNELEAFLTYLDGGTVEPAAGTREFADAPVGMGDEHYYNPEPESHDVWKRELGFPDHPGALAAAVKPYATAGLGMPWLSCFGNHDCLVQGRAAAPTGYDELLTGDAKPVSTDAQAAPDGDKLDAYVADPRWVAHGEQHPIVPDRERALVSKADYVRRHLAASGVPTGHGFTQANAEEGTAYYVYDEIPGIRLIVLDTTNAAGHVDGCIDDAQFRWLAERLDEVDGPGAAGAVDAPVTVDGANAVGAGVLAGTAGRLVVLASHHGLSTLNNGHGAGDARGTLHLADDVEALLHRHPNVVLWLSGHTHKNKITPRPGATPEAGFWEVSTGAVSEWPVQFRAVEFYLEQPPGAPAAPLLRIRTTMVDTTAPAAPDGRLSLEDLAALHRELAANDAGSVGGLYADGTPADRNQDLLLALTPETVAVARRTLG